MSVSAGVRSRVIRALAGTAARPERPPQTPNGRAAAAQLLKSLAEFDPGAADFLEEGPSALRTLFPDPDWAQFETLVQSYSFAEAQARLERAVTSSSIP